MSALTDDDYRDIAARVPMTMADVRQCEATVRNWMAMIYPSRHWPASKLELEQALGLKPF